MRIFALISAVVLCTALFTSTYVHAGNVEVLTVVDKQFAPFLISILLATLAVAISNVYIWRGRENFVASITAFAAAIAAIITTTAAIITAIITAATITAIITTAAAITAIIITITIVDVDNKKRYWISSCIFYFLLAGSISSFFLLVILAS